MEPANVVGRNGDDLLGYWGNGVVALLGLGQKRRFVHQVPVGMVNLDLVLAFGHGQDVAAIRQLQFRGVVHYQRVAVLHPPRLVAEPLFAAALRRMMQQRNDSVARDVGIGGL